MKSINIIYGIAIIALVIITIKTLPRMQTKEQATAREKGALEIIAGRKSVRKYLNRPVEEEKITALLKAGMAAPSGKDTRPWTFLVVTRRETLDSMATRLPYAKMLTSTPLAIVVCGDPSISSYWYLDCSAAAQNILLAAEAQELGAVWTAAYPYEERIQAVRSATHLPENLIPLCVIPVGYPDGPHRPKDKFNPSKIIRVE